MKQYLILILAILLIIIPASAIYTIDSIDIKAINTDASYMDVYYNLYGPSTQYDVQYQIERDFRAFTPTVTGISKPHMYFTLHNFVYVPAMNEFNETYYYTYGATLGNDSVIPYEMTITFPDKGYTYHFYSAKVLPPVIYKTPNAKTIVITPKPTPKKPITPTPYATPIMIITPVTPTPAPTPAPTQTPSKIMQPADLIPKTIPGYEWPIAILGLISVAAVITRKH